MDRGTIITSLPTLVVPIYSKDDVCLVRENKIMWQGKTYTVIDISRSLYFLAEEYRWVSTVNDVHYFYCHEPSFSELEKHFLEADNER